MSRRYPGNFLSSELKITSDELSGTYGIFGLPYQMQAKNNNSWENVLLQDFPVNYQTLINSFSGTKYYISPTGSDSNSGLSEVRPLQTYAQFDALTSTDTSSIMCIFLPGEYTLPSLPGASSFGECCIVDNNNPRTFVCAPGKVVFNWTANLGRRDAAPLHFRNSGSSIYGAILKRNNNGRTTNYTVAMINNGTVTFVGKAYNTVYQEVGTNGNWSLTYANGGFPVGTELNYCTFAVTEVAGTSYSGNSGLAVYYCAGNYTYTSSSATFTNWVTAGGTMNSTTYEIAGGSGVYNGTYAWPAP